MAGVVKGIAARAQGSVDIDNTVRLRTIPISAPHSEEHPTPTAAENAAEGIAQEGAVRPAVQSAQLEDIVQAEVDWVRRFYTEEGEKALAEARQRAASIVAATEQQAAQYAEQAKEQADELFRKSREDGFAQGHDDGYKKGLMKCKDMLLELKAASERINAEKEELFEQYETEIFDTVMEIVNRVTLSSLAQKDKAVIKKTVKEAGKAFRNSEYVKITLSKTDITEEMAADTDYFKKLFSGVKTVELEVLKDAPSGTVILDNGSEIADAGIATQLKMIEELGRGKYRRAPSARRKKAAQQAEEAVPQEDAPSEETAAEEAAEE